MNPKDAPKIEKATRKQFPDGIEAHGTDALRFTFASFATAGRDIRFDLQRLEGYRNFCNKLWNAARYVLMQCEDQDTGLDESLAIELSVADRWIRSKLQTVETEVTDHLDNYRFDLAAQALYEFTWYEYCDWYLELTKPVLSKNNSNEAAKRGTRRTLVRVLEVTLRMLHPIMPFITEEIWQSIKGLAGKTGNSIMLEAWPKADQSKLDNSAVAEVEWLKTFIMGVRRIRSEMDIKPGQVLDILLQNWNANDQSLYTRNQTVAQSMAKVGQATWLTQDAIAPESATALVGEMQILIPLAGLIDKDAEIARLTKEIEKIEKNLVGVEARLNNPAFVEKAKPEVIETARKQADEQKLALGQLQAQLEKMRGL